MQLPQYEDLAIQDLSGIFKRKTESYKLFWFQAIVRKTCEGKRKCTFEELVDEMIADAWYMVAEYHLNLGPSDQLEAVVKHIHEKTNMKSTEKRDVILKYLRTTEDMEVFQKKKQLIKNVPYRLQSTFMKAVQSHELDAGKRAVIERINRQEHLIYYFGNYEELNTVILLQEDWVSYIQKNQEIIRGWIQFNLIQYLQKRNPNVPGLADKLEPPQVRKLEAVKRYWHSVMEVHPIKDIYGNITLDTTDLSIDHFVPWSYVAHDELWNLNPTTRSINSSKSNCLPDWNTYFPLLCQQEFLAYELMWQHEKIREEFVKCAKEHVNSDDVMYRLYRKELQREEFVGQLENVILPIYQAAERSGFGSWKYTT